MVVEEYSDVEAAMAALPVSVERRPEVRRLIAGLVYRRVWIPESRKYVALADDGPVVAYVNRGFVDVRDAAGGHSTHLLPGADGDHSRAARSRSGTGARVAGLCSTCFTQLPLTGVCDECG
ncbi:hypothetical protein [Quadrisphaera sp. KR29]|uniref:hypothetical protein n=1 Tax=Quadrisphaera sp. KR29 TaxID=3461391 RepID=UPI004043C330